MLPCWNDYDPVRYAKAAAVEAAFAARMLVAKKAIGEQVQPLGYFITNAEIGKEGAVITRHEEGGIDVTPFETRETGDAVL